MTFRIVHLITFVCLGLAVLAQPSRAFQGVVRDAVTGKPLPDVHISLVETSSGAVSKKDGSFQLDVPTGRPFELLVTLVGYAPLNRTIPDSGGPRSEPIVFLLTRQAIQLPEVDIARPAPEVVYQRTDLHVGDHFINDEGVWVLTYEKPRLWHPEGEAGRQVYRDARLHLLDTLFVERCSIRLPTEVVRLRHDHAQRTIVEGVGKAWYVQVQKDELALQAMDLPTLNDRVLPWTDSINGTLLGSNFSVTYPAFDHFAFDPSDNTTHAICAVEDERLMELFRSQYKYMSGADKVIAMDLGLETGIDPEIIAGYMTAFYNDPYFDPPYAPLFVVRDTLCVFDHYRERIRRFLPDRTAVDEIPITHQRERTWRTRLIQDPTDGTVYAFHSKNLHTWVRSIDPTTGQQGPIRMLDHPFPEDVQLHGGHAYYIYRPYGSLQHRTLYRQAVW